MWTVIIGIICFLIGLLLGATSINVIWADEVTQDFRDDSIQILGTVNGKYARLLSGDTYYTSSVLHMPIEFKIDHFNRDETLAIDANGSIVSIDDLYIRPRDVPQR